MLNQPLAQPFADPPKKASDLSRDPALEAAELGLVLVDSLDKRLKPHLQIDLDSDEALEEFNRNWGKWCECRGPGWGRWDSISNDPSYSMPFFTTSKSGKGKHAYVILKGAMEAKERVLIQAVLGSDRRREMFNFLRLEKQGDGCGKIVLFETQEEAERVWAFLTKDPTTVSFPDE